MSKKTETELPWPEPGKWKADEWYPMPIGFLVRDQKEYIIDGYMIFRADPVGSGDIVPVHNDITDALNFTTALEICEGHNQRRMLI